MKNVLTFALLALLINNAVGQELKLDRTRELKRVFWNLPIDTTLTVLIDTAKTNTFYTDGYDNSYTSNPPTNSYFKYPPKIYQLEILTSPCYYGIDEQTIDSILVSTIDARYGDRLTKGIKKQYKSLIKTFKKLSVRTKEFEVYADQGTVGAGFYFFQNKEDSLPYLSISLNRYLTFYPDDENESVDVKMNHDIQIKYYRVNKW